jgi:hypothetical protein
VDKTHAQQVHVPRVAGMTPDRLLIAAMSLIGAILVILFVIALVASAR